MFGSAPEEELTTLSRYTWCASIALALGGAGHYEAIWSGQQRVEKQWLEESFHGLRLQRDKYRKEIQTTCTCLTEIKDALAPLNLIGSLDDQVTHMIRTVVRKNQALADSQKGLKSLDLENASMT